MRVEHNYYFPVCFELHQISHVFMIFTIYKFTKATLFFKPIDEIRPIISDKM